MSYYLDAWIAKREVFDSLDCPCVNLSQGYAITTKTPDFNESVAIDIAHVCADFFGGVGEQSATLYMKGAKTYFGPSYSAINKALAKLGVVKTEDKDEFDTLGLGYNRDNDWLPADYDSEDDLPF